jgi:hypothetical protein
LVQTTGITSASCSQVQRIATAFVGANTSAQWPALFERLMQAFVALCEAEVPSKKSRMLDAQTWRISLFGALHILVTSCAVSMPVPATN